MARSQNSFLKKQLEQNKAKKKKEKEQRKHDRHENATGGNLENMMAYVDEFGNISSTPPNTTPPEEKS
jgi:predicted secreted Zn-dependent protease